MASILSSSAVNLVHQSSGRDEVYVASVPLRAAKGPAQLLMSTAYNLSLWDLQHFMVIIKPASPPHSQVCAFDFQPIDPENIYVALAALSGRPVPGVVLARKMARLPRKRCWFVGRVDAGAIDRSYEFNESWQSGLRIGSHDCRDYANGCFDRVGGASYAEDAIFGAAERVKVIETSRKAGWKTVMVGSMSFQPRMACFITQVEGQDFEQMCRGKH